MNLEPNNKSLSFAEFLDAATRDKAEAKPFPYTMEVCRCRYCSFCQNGKCALKRCCCMNERVKARSCTFAELLRDCFANFKDNVFQFRLRIACERATELHTCLMEYMARHHDDLLKSMTDEQRDIFERFDDCWSEYASLAEEAIFVYAFRLGAQMMLDVLSKPACPQD